MELNNGCLKRREFPGVDIVNGKNARIPGIPTIIFQQKTLLSNRPNPQKMLSPLPPRGNRLYGCEKELRVGVSQKENADQPTNTVYCTVDCFNPLTGPSLPSGGRLLRYAGNGSPPLLTRESHIVGCK